MKLKGTESNEGAIFKGMFKKEEIDSWAKVWMKWGCMPNEYLKEDAGSGNSIYKRAEKLVYGRSRCG